MIRDKLQEVKGYLTKNNINAWVIYQFIDMNPMFNKALGTEKKVVTRRTMLIIDQEGEVKLIHSKVDGGFEDLGLDEITYTSYQQFQKVCKEHLGKYKKVAMEYSPLSAIPHISKVDAGMVDLVRSLGIEVVSSGDLMQIVGQLSDEEVESHLKAARAVDEVRKWTFNQLEKDLSDGKEVNEYTIQQMILNKFKEKKLETVYEPQTTINENSARGHYLPNEDEHNPFRKGDLLLIDMWAKLPGETSIFADMTWMLFRGDEVPEKYQKAFDTVKGARDRAIKFLRKRVKEGSEVKGWEVDKVARDFIAKKGYGKYFRHRLGHSIGTFVHGDLTHLDGFENKDDRKIFPNHISSVEPGIYIPDDFGVRTEVDILVTEDDLKVTTEIQDDIYLLP